MNLGPGNTIVIVLALVILGGCAGSASQDAMDIERRLSAAGFQMKLADTPEKLAHLQSMGQRRLIPTSREGDMVFVYADAELCKCLYVGSEKNYQEYQRLAIKQNIADEQRATAREDNMAAQTNADMNWRMWGAWPRPIIY